jgi:hypothetical protein
VRQLLRRHLAELGGRVAEIGVQHLHEAGDQLQLLVVHAVALGDVAQGSDDGVGIVGGHRQIGEQRRQVFAVGHRQAC